MTEEQFETMEKSPSRIISNKFESSIISMFLQLREDGFKQDEIREYLERVVGFVVEGIEE